MKVVQGNYRQYQLVDKTRKKDIDGIRYLIAGERNLWAKLLRDKSETKKAEIYNLITRNGSTGFERLIELLTDEKGKFVGYTFYGPDMDIVPEKKQDTGIPPVNNPDIPDFSKPPVSTSGPTSGVTQLIILVVIGVLMLFIMKNLLNRYLLIFIYENISQVAGEGCARLSFDGILPGAVGIAALVLYQRKTGGDMDTIQKYCLMAVLSFAAGVLITYVVIGIICVLVIGIFGVVKTYQSVIFTVIIAAVLIKMFLPGRRR